MSIFELLILALFFLLPAISRWLQKRKEAAGAPARTDESQVEAARQREQLRERQREQMRERQQRPREQHPHYDTSPQYADEPQYQQPDSLADALRQIREALGEPAPSAQRPAPATVPRPQKEPAISDSERLENLRHSEFASRETRAELAPPTPPIKVRVPRPKGEKPSKLARSIRSEVGARNAFILREVLDTPRSLRGRRPRPH